MKMSSPLSEVGCFFYCQKSERSEEEKEGEEANDYAESVE